jgi:hypothetical protein
MARIKLKLEHLSVESFETAEVPSTRGTVHARQFGGTNTCVSSGPTCAGEECTRATLCMASCQMECQMDTGTGPIEIGWG